jgi:hypothetical protein
MIGCFDMEYSHTKEAFLRQLIDIFSMKVMHFSSICLDICEESSVYWLATVQTKVSVICTDPSTLFTLQLPTY